MGYLRFVLCWLVLCAVPLHAEQTLTQGFMHQGTERKFVLVSDGQAAKARPLIVHLHGYRSPEDIAGSGDLEVIRWGALERRAVQDGFLVVAPAALKGRWNMGLDLPNITLESGEKVDDVGFVRGLVRQLVQSGIADPSQIYITGISDGGIMANLIMCSGGHPFAAAATLISTMYEQHARTCTRSGAIPVFLLAGTHDAVLPYDGWMFPAGRTLSMPETAEFWRKRLGCTGQTTTLLPDVRRKDHTRVRQVDWTGCKGPVGVRLLRVEGGGHSVPSTAGAKMLKFGWTGDNYDIESSEQVLAFFDAVATGGAQ